MREWIVTNGLGSYSSLTHKNTNTRKYHGLLVASLNPPTKRWVFVSNVYDKIQINNQSYDLNNYNPKFSFDYFPNFLYDVEGVKIKKTIFMPYEKNTTIIMYKINTKKPVTLVHSPIVNSRHIYDVNSQRYLTFLQNKSDDIIFITPDNTNKTIKLKLKDCFFKSAHFWETLYYNKDHQRNDSWIDNNIHIGDFYKLIDKSNRYFLVLSIEDNIEKHPLKMFFKEKQRKKKLINQTGLSKKFEKLVLSSDNFIVKKGEGKSIIAGYHWFADWGRDTLIALPGLCLVTKRYDEAKKILKSFGNYCKNGLIPNAFMENDTVAVYNTVDASLWFIDRVYQYFKYTIDRKFVEEIWNVLTSIIKGYKNGTDFGIGMNNDFLINHDEGLTWMDVKIGDYYPTPRNRKAVEIQALWYNALMIMSTFSKILGKKDDFLDLANSVKNNFNVQYKAQYDVIDTKDLSFRPNQIFLVSLDFSMINKNLAKKIVNDVEDKLLTVFGLRTLSPEDPCYKGSLFGNYNKDEAYHNGTIWPWLMGPFIKAFVKINGHQKNKRIYAFRNFIKPMLDVFGDCWDGSIYEIFDGDPVFEPRGCISQAWSVAEILRAWVEDIENIKPSN
ncbi:MAG: glycogen debranching enzyme family protein [Thermoplasmatales archaeon]|nr:MAG: glycogen debranching enzyme family protein [Thermoplasmatales archaeon]